MKHISIIVPIFHGKKYIDGMIAQLEKCAGQCGGRYALELLLINDDPGEAIGCFSSDKIEIKMIETDRNRGIHGARVRGLENCSGDYVLFLDQDDRIESAYFSSQLEHLGDGDAVVCRLLHEGKQFYDTRMPFEQVITREFIISVRNPIISPGQVLIRKSSIPKAWTEAALKNNGADDWLLWLCMLAEQREFSLNPEILFEHVVAGNNESINVAHMMASEQEIYEVLSAGQVLAREELETLGAAIQAAAQEHIKLLSKFQKIFFVYDEWLKLQEQGISIHDYLRKRGIHSVAIYGFSYIGKRLYHSLNTEEICVKYFIDMNAEYLKEEAVPIYRPEAPLPEVDMMIISLVDGVDNIREKLAGLSEAKICTVTELFEDMKNGR